MDCSLSQLLLTLGRTDLGSDDRAALDRHAAGCPSCAALARQVSGFDAAVAAAMAAVPVPPTLHDHLLTAAYARRGALWRRAVYRYAALAAGVVVAVGLVSGGLWRFRPALDGYALVNATEQGWEDRKTAVRDWLARQDLPPEFPAAVDPDFQWYTFHGKGELGGREVPVVVFQRGTHQARVYVVREGVLNTSGLQPEEGSIWRVDVVPHATRRGVSYVILHTNSLDLFRRQPAGTPG
jgi:hypothetical protein